MHLRYEEVRVADSRLHPELCRFGSHQGARVCVCVCASVRGLCQVAEKGLNAAALDCGSSNGRLNPPRSWHFLCHGPCGMGPEQKVRVHS